MKKKVAITGGAGRLGRALAHALANEFDVRGIDMTSCVYPDHWASYTVDLHDRAGLEQALDGVDVVVHAAALHGYHLLSGTTPWQCWENNVAGTWNLLRAVCASGVRRVVFVSSTSVFGPGSAAGPARVLEENVPVQFDDIYDVSKLVGEALMRHCSRQSFEAVTVRLGRFFYADRWDYHWRKLSTGVDVADATSAIAALCRAPALRHETYCVASDLPLDHDQRVALGIDVKAVLAEAAPDVLSAAERLGAALPGRVGKSVSTQRLRLELDWSPSRDLAWWARAALAEPDPDHPPVHGPWTPREQGLTNALAMEVSA